VDVFGRWLRRAQGSGPSLANSAFLEEVSGNTSMAMGHICLENEDLLLKSIHSVHFFASDGTRASTMLPNYGRSSVKKDLKEPNQISGAISHPGANQSQNRSIPARRHRQKNQTAPVHLLGACLGL